MPLWVSFLQLHGLYKQVPLFITQYIFYMIEIIRFKYTHVPKVPRSLLTFRLRYLKMQFIDRGR